MGQLHRVEQVEESGRRDPMFDVLHMMLQEHEGWSILCRSLGIEPPGAMGGFVPYGTLSSSLQMIGLRRLTAVFDKRTI